MGDAAVDDQLFHGYLHAVRLSRSVADMCHCNGSGIRVEQVGFGRHACRELLSEDYLLRVP